MGFIQHQQERLAMRLIAWQYQRKNLPIPDPVTLRVQAKQIVADAHRIARERGSNVAGIMKELIADIRNRQ